MSKVSEKKETKTTSEKETKPENKETLPSPEDFVKTWEDDKNKTVDDVIRAFGMDPKDKPTRHKVSTFSSKLRKLGVPLSKKGKGRTALLNEEKISELKKLHASLVNGEK